MISTVRYCCNTGPVTELYEIGLNSGQLVNHRTGDEIIQNTIINYKHYPQMHRIIRPAVDQENASYEYYEYIA